MKYVGAFLGTLLGLLAVNFIVYKFVFHDSQFGGIWFIASFFLVMGLAFCWLLGKMENMPSRKFINWFMGMTGVKLLVALVVVLLCVLLKPDNLVRFLVNFLVYYVAFLIFEIWTLTKVSKQSKTSIDIN